MLRLPSGPSPITLRPAEIAEAPAIAEMVYLCGPNLLSQAFGPGYEETVACLALLVSQPMTMFSYEFARVASAREAGGGPEALAGLVIGLTQGDYGESERRMARITMSHKGFWRWIRLLPLAMELSRCAEPLAPSTYYISALSVREPWRRSGIAVRMLELSQELASERGCQSIVLDVEMGNTPAQTLYERMGYSVASECPAGRLMRRHGIIGLRRMQRTV